MTKLNQTLNSVPTRLKLETLKRTFIGSIFQVILVISFWNLFLSFEESVILWPTCLLIIAGMALFRTAMCFAHRKNPERLLSQFQLHMVLLTFSSFLWGGLSAYSIFHTGLNSLEGFAFTFMGMGLLSGSLYILAAANTWRLLFLTGITLPMGTSIFLTSVSHFETTCGAFVVVFSVYVFWAGRSISRELFLSYTTEADLRAEKEKLQNVVDELLNMRAQLEVQRSKAEYSSRLATLGEMAAGIAHEINNPLAVILGNASQITRSLKATENIDPVKVLERAEKIIKTSYRISKIIHGLRSFSRQGDHDPFEMTALSQLMEDTLELCREKFYSNGIGLLLQAAPQIQIPIRAVQISQVLVNLLNNAFDAINQANKNTHSETKNLKNHFIEICFRQEAEDLYIRVSNSGPAISPEIADRMFNPFFTTKELGKGTGLGLSISRGLVQEHGGELSLVPGTGITCFEIRLPLSRSQLSPNFHKKTA